MSGSKYHFDGDFGKHLFSSQSTNVETKNMNFSAMHILTCSGIQVMASSPSLWLFSHGVHLSRIKTQLGFACSLVEINNKTIPKWWCPMVMYHDRIRKQKTQTQLRCLDKNLKNTVFPKNHGRIQPFLKKTPKRRPDTMSASKTLHNSVGVPQIQRYGALSVRKSCHHHHLRPRRNVFSFRGSGASRIE